MRKSIPICISILSVFILCSLSYQPIIADTPISKPNTSIDDPMNSPWPMFGHDKRHSGRSQYGVDGNTLYEKWRFRLDGPIFRSNPVIGKDGTIYVGGGKGSVLHAINPDGTEKWRYIIKEEDILFSDITTPLIDKNGIIYAGSYNGFLYALYPNGTFFWKVKLKYGIISSPVISDIGIIYIGAYDKFFAVAPNGTIKWMYLTGAPIRASPVIGIDNTIYVSSHDGYLYAFYPDNGTVKWQVKIGGYISCYSSPCIGDDGIIYAGGYDLFAIWPNGTIKWVRDIPLVMGGPHIGFDGMIYTTCSDHGTTPYRLWAINPDGSIKWSFWIGDTGCPIIANNGMIYATRGRGGTGTHSISLISPEGKKIHSLQIVPDETDFLGNSGAIGADGTYYIGTWYDEKINIGWESVGDLVAIGTLYNQPPNKPTLNGPINGETWKDYTYSSSTNDPDGNDIYYLFDWDDDSDSGWLGPFESGETVTSNHTWVDTGVHIVKIYAKDKYDAENESDELEVSLTGADIEIIGFIGGIPLKIIVANIGTKAAYNIPWEVVIIGRDNWAGDIVDSIDGNITRIDSRAIKIVSVSYKNHFERTLRAKITATVSTEVKSKKCYIFGMNIPFTLIDRT